MSLSSLSLSFDELRTLQVDVRLKNGTFLLDLLPLSYKMSSSDTSPIPPTDTGPDYLHFQVVHDSLGPLLHIFASKTLGAQYKILPCPRNCDDLVPFGHDNFMAYSDNLNTPRVPNGEPADRDAPYSLSALSAFNNFSSPEELLPKNLYPWTSDHFPSAPSTSSRSFSDESSMNGEFSTAVNDDNLQLWTSEILIDDLGNEKDIISTPILDNSPYFPANNMTPTTSYSRPAHSSETSVHATNEPIAPQSGSRANSSPPSCQSARYNIDTDNVATSSGELLAPSIWSEGEETGERPFACNEFGCSRSFKNQHTLRSHMGTHRSKRPTSFPCTLGCSERFTRQHDRLRHEVAKHGKVCEWLCEHCGRFFSLKKTLAHHKCPMMTVGETRWVN